MFHIPRKYKISPAAILVTDQKKNHTSASVLTLVDEFHPSTSSKLNLLALAMNAVAHIVQ